jgi:hypothetical protein
VSRYLLEAQLENMGEAAVCLEVCLVILHAILSVRHVGFFNSSCVLSVQLCILSMCRDKTSVLFDGRCTDKSRKCLGPIWLGAKPTIVRPEA